MKNAKEEACKLFGIATPVLTIHGVGGQKWKRNVKSGSRIGPWLQGEYKILNDAAWKEKAPCLYIVSTGAKSYHYAGISRNRLKDRWRTSPAYDAISMQRLAKDQIFHSQCWKNIERESALKPDLIFEIRSIKGETITQNQHIFNAEIRGLSVVFAEDGESLVASIERLLCNNKGPDFFNWNIAMTAKK